jgi:hypothetical protein
MEYRLLDPLMRISKVTNLSLLILVVMLALTEPRESAAQGGVPAEPTIQKIVQVIQEALQGKTKLLSIDPAVAFAKGAGWGLVALRDGSFLLNLSDVAVLGIFEAKQKTYLNNTLIEPGRYYLVLFPANASLTETTVLKQPQDVRMAMVPVPADVASTDKTVRANLHRVAGALIARSLAQPSAFNVIRAARGSSNEFLLGLTLEKLSVCWEVTPQAKASAKPRAANRNPSLVLRPITREGFAAMGDELTLDASESRDPDGQLSAVAWALGEDPHSVNAILLTSPVELRKIHRFEHRGKFTITLKASDDQCGFSQVSQPIEIRPWLTVTIHLHTDFLQVPVSGPIALRTDVFNNSLYRRFEGQTTVEVDETPLFGPAPVQVDPQQGLAGVPSSFEFRPPLGLGKHRLSVILRQPSGIERGRDDLSFEVPPVSIALKPIGETVLQTTGQIKFETVLQNIVRTDFKGTLELFLIKPDRSRKSLGPKQPVEVKAGFELELPVALPAAGLPKGNLIFTAELRTSSGSKVDQASIVYVVQ